MSDITAAQSQIIDTIYNKFNGKYSKCFIKTLLLISHGQRTALKNFLLSAKATVMGEINEWTIRNLRYKKLEAGMLATTNAVSMALNQVKNPASVFSMALGVVGGSDCDDLTQFINKMIKSTHVPMPKLPALKLGDLDKLTNDSQEALYTLNKARMALDLSRDALTTLNDYSKIVDEYINLLDEF
jgi:hypothetical protein